MKNKKKKSSWSTYTHAIAAGKRSAHKNDDNKEAIKVSARYVVWVLRNSNFFLVVVSIVVASFGVLLCIFVEL